MAEKMQVRMTVRALMTEPMHRAKYGIISLATTPVRATGAYRCHAVKIKIEQQTSKHTEESHKWITLKQEIHLVLT